MLPFARILEYGNIRPVVPQIIKIDGNSGSVLMLYNNGELYGWGRNANSELGTGNSVVVPNLKLIDTGVSDFYCGQADFMYRKGNTFYVSGSGYVVGTSETKRTTFTNITTELFGTIDINTVKDFQIGLGSHMLTTSGDLYAAGFAGLGEYGNGSTKNSAKLTLVNTGVEAMWDNQNASVYIKKNNLMYSTGFNNYSQLGVASTASSITTFTQITKFTSNIDFNKFYATLGNVYYIDATTNAMYGTGTNASGSFGTGTNVASVNSFSSVIGFSVDNMSKVFRTRSSATSVPIISSGNSIQDGIYMSGYNTAGNIGNGSTTGTAAKFVRSVSADSIVSNYELISHMFAHSFNTYFVYANNLYGCGATVLNKNMLGSLPSNSTEIQSTFIQIPTPY